MIGCSGILRYKRSLPPLLYSSSLQRSAWDFLNKNGYNSGTCVGIAVPATGHFGSARGAVTCLPASSKLSTQDSHTSVNRVCLSRGARDHHHISKMTAALARQCIVRSTQRRGKRKRDQEEISGAVGHIQYGLSADLRRILK